MKKLMLKNCKIDSTKLKDIIALCVFGSYHEKVFDKDRSDIDIMILSKYQLELYDEIEIEDYLQKILSEYFLQIIFILLLLVSLIILLVKSY